MNEGDLNPVKQVVELIGDVLANDPAAGPTIIRTLPGNGSEAVFRLLADAAGSRLKRRLIIVAAQDIFPPGSRPGVALLVLAVVRAVQREVRGPMPLFDLLWRRFGPTWNGETGPRAFDRTVGNRAQCAALGQSLERRRADLVELARDVLALAVHRMSSDTLPPLALVDGLEEFARWYPALGEADWLPPLRAALGPARPYLNLPVPLVIVAPLPSVDTGEAVIDLPMWPVEDRAGRLDPIVVARARSVIRRTLDSAPEHRPAAFADDDAEAEAIRLSGGHLATLQMMAHQLAHLARASGPLDVASVGRHINVFDHPGRRVLDDAGRAVLRHVHRTGRLPDGGHMAPAVRAALAAGALYWYRDDGDRYAVDPRLRASIEVDHEP